MANLLGCLIFLVFFVLIIGVSVVGSVISAIWQLFVGPRVGNPKPRSGNDYTQGKETPDPDYKFSPSDGEYIDYEEVDTSSRSSHD